MLLLAPSSRLGRLPARAKFPRPPAAPVTQVQDRVRWAQFFDDHAAAVLGFATLLVENVDVAATVAGHALVNGSSTVSVVDSHEAERVLALAVLQVCRRVAATGRVAALDDRRVVVGLAEFGRLNSHQIAAAIGRPEGVVAALLQASTPENGDASDLSSG